MYICMYVCMHACMGGSAGGQFEEVVFLLYQEDPGDGIQMFSLVWCVPLPLEPSLQLPPFFFLIKLFKNFLLNFIFMCIDVRMSGPLELELQTVLSCHVGAGN